jgi:hypothetical protein
MKEDFFKVGYSKYLNKNNHNEKKRTNYIFNKLFKNRFIIVTSSIIIMCSFINFFLIYKFIRIIDISYRY